MSLISSLTSGVSALKSFTRGIEVIGNNIANVNTTAFKASRVDYSDSFSNLLKQSSVSPNGSSGSNQASSQVGTGVQVGAISSRFTQGQLNSTGITTDLGIVGEGFFKVDDTINNLSLATRAGNFRLDDRGYMVTLDGFRLQGLTGGTITYDVTDVGGEITFTPTTIAPTTVGDIRLDFSLAVGSGLTNSTGGAFTDAQVEAAAPGLRGMSIDKLGNIQLILSNGDVFDAGKVLLMDFKDPQALVAEGNGLYSGFEAAGIVGSANLTVADNSPGGNSLGTLQSGTLEQSNVDLAEEFTNMITIQRSFQAGARIITVSDDILNEVVNLKR